jgi:hypothetical protein
VELASTITAREKVPPPAAEIRQHCSGGKAGIEAPETSNVRKPRADVIQPFGPSLKMEPPHHAIVTGGVCLNDGS